jgi:hypothetical protein
MRVGWRVAVGTLLAVGLLVVGAPDALAAARSFSDVPPGHPFRAEIGWAAERFIVDGYPDGTFRPGAPIDRQAAVAMLHRFVGGPQEPVPDPRFTDVPRRHTFHHEVAWAADEGVSDGFPDGTFRPVHKVHRGALVALLHRLSGAPGGPFPNPGFTDITPGHPFYEEIAWARTVGISLGQPDGTFGPDQVVTRQALAAMLTRLHDLDLVERYEPTAYDFTDDGRADHVLVHRWDGTWRYASNPTPFFAPEISSVWPTQVAGDYDGLNGYEPALYHRDGRWETGGRRGVIHFPMPNQTDLEPAPADYDGDGRTEPAYFNGLTAIWHVEGQPPVQFGIGINGAPGPWPDEVYDMPLPADYDGDGIDEIAVYRPTDGTVHVRGVGQIADLPVGHAVAADFDGDGDDEPAVYRGWIERKWHFVDGSALNGREGAPAPADYNGDGRAEPWVMDGFGDEAPYLLESAVTAPVSWAMLRLWFLMGCELDEYGC